MPNGSATAAAGTRGLADHCRWLGDDNRTDPRAKAQLEAAECLFLAIVPHGRAATALTCAFATLTAFSLAANGLMLFGLRRSEDLSWEPRFAFLKTLIVSDLLQTLTFGPAVTHSLVRRRTMEVGVWCGVQFFVGTVCVFSSLVTITCMALERYLYVCHAVSYLVILTRERLRVVLTLIWVYSLSVGATIVALLYAGKGRTREDEAFVKGLLCEPDAVEQYLGSPRAAAVFRKAVGSSTLLLCLLAYAFSYLRMYRAARDAVVPFNAVNTTARRTVMFYCGMLLLQLLPLLLKVTTDVLWEVEGTVTFVSLSTRDLRETRSSPAGAAAAFHLSLLIMLMVPPSVNPLVYGLRSAEMRRALRRTLRRWTERWCAGARGAEVGNVARPNRAQAG